jgi:hypothetical protein
VGKVLARMVDLPHHHPPHFTNQVLRRHLFSRQPVRSTSLPHFTFSFKVTLPPPSLQRSLQTERRPTSFAPRTRHDLPLWPLFPPRTKTNFIETSRRHVSSFSRTVSSDRGAQRGRIVPGRRKAACERGESRAGTRYVLLLVRLCAALYEC